MSTVPLVPSLMAFTASLPRYCLAIASTRAGNIDKTIFPAVVVTLENLSSILYLLLSSLNSPIEPTKGSLIKSFSHTLKYKVVSPLFIRYCCHILTNVVLAVPHSPLIANTQPLLYIDTICVNISAYLFLPNLQLAKGLSCGISKSLNLLIIYIWHFLDNTSF